MNDRVRPKQLWLLNTALLVIALLLPGVQFLAGSAKETTNQVLDENWRGSYDILVTHPDFHAEIAAAKNDLGLDLVEVNYGNIAAPTISAEQLSQVRETPGVAVAAPLGYLGAQTGTEKWAKILVPWDEIPERDSVNFKFNLRTTSNDGVSERLETDAEIVVTVDTSLWDGHRGDTDEPSLAGEHGLVISYPGQQVQYPDGVILPEGLFLTVHPIPTPNTTMLAVDPGAERQLLGAEGEFLDPLEKAAAVLKQRGGLTAAGYQWLLDSGAEASAEPTVPAEFAGFPGLADLENAPAVWGSFGLDSQLVPYLRNSAAYPPLSLELSVSRQQQSAEYEPLGSERADLQQQMRPFSVFDFNLPWPGSSVEIPAGIGYNVVQEYEGAAIAGLSLQPHKTDDGKTAFRVNPQGYSHGVEVYPGYTPDGRLLGETAKYRSSEERELLIGPVAQPGAAPFEAGSYDPADLARLGAAPLGTYQEAEITLSSGEVLHPDRTGLGLGVQPPHVIVPLDYASELLAGDAVTAVRVRVSGIDELDRRTAQLRIDETAQRLRALGLSAQTVSGSSTQQIPIYVAGYAFGSADAETQQRVGDLGWVTQNFTVTGSDQWTAETASNVILWASMILLGLLVVGLGVVSVMVRPGRAQNQQLLAQLGWSLPQRIRWAAQESWLGIAVLLVAVPLSCWVADPSQLPLVLLVSLLVVLLLLYSVPLRGRGAKPLPKIASRRKLLGLAATETAAIAVTAVVVAVLAQLLIWFVQVGSTLSLSRLVLNSLLPLAVLALGVVVFLLYLQLVSGALYERLILTRLRFKYVVLGRSGAGLMGGLLLQTALQTVAAAALIGLILWGLRLWFIATPAGLLVAFGALGLWALSQGARLYRLRATALLR